jgi:hypothetical protein
VIGAYHKCGAETVARFDGFVAKYMGMGSVERAEAQREIATDWRAAYLEWINPKGCG